jgi:hypothetical protein
MAFSGMEESPVLIKTVFVGKNCVRPDFILNPSGRGVNVVDNRNVGSLPDGRLFRREGDSFS